ncbi:MAG TPA: dihydrofolate reductase family protein [Allosphingosinicella sp.]|nr:dihydrofolate reductase family protein [Allosphingosinicella sp.]
MRKVIVQTFVTLDGVMQAPGAPDEDREGGFRHGGWSFNYWDEMMGERMDEAMKQPYDLLLGRKTYDIFAAHWPKADHPVVTPKFNAAVKYVATSSPETLEWENSVALEGDVGEAVRALRAGEGPDLSVQGSSRLIQALLAAGLVDELWLWTFPIVLGEGKRLFGDGARLLGFRLEAIETSTTGVAITRYVSTEPAEPGSFALEEGR